MLELVVPGILAGVACYGMAKGVDVYDALLVGAGKGLEILLKILPALVTLLTVVAMLRASGGLEVLADGLAGHPTGDGGTDAGAAHQRERGAGGGVGTHLDLRAGLHHRTDGGGDAGVYRDDVLYHRRLFRRDGHPEEPLRSPGGAVCGRGGVLFCGIDSSTIYEIKSDNVDKFPLRNGQKPAGALQGNRQKGEPQTIHKLTLEDLKLP